MSSFVASPLPIADAVIPEAAFNPMSMVSALVSELVESAVDLSPNPLAGPFVPPAEEELSILDPILNQSPEEETEEVPEDWVEPPSEEPASPPALEVTLPMITSTQETLNVILNTFSQVVFHPTTLAFLHLLLTKRESFLAEAPSVEALVPWVGSLPPAISQAMLDQLGPLEDPTLPEVRRIILRVMGLGLVEGIEKHHLENLTDRTVLPWDILSLVRPDWASLFEITATSNPELDVSVVVGDQTATLAFTRDTALGLLFFARLSGHHFTPSMFGEPLSYFESPEDIQSPWNRLTAGPNYFQSPEFNRGLRTGAMWINQDINLYLQPIAAALSAQSPSPTAFPPMPSPSSLPPISPPTFEDPLTFNTFHFQPPAIPVFSS